MGSEDSTLQAGSTVRRPEPGAPLQRGCAVGRYLVLDVLGHGAMGRVYAAYDPQLDRKVALKQLRLEHLGQAQRERAQRALLKEAQALARLGHAHVVGVHDVLVHEHDLVIAMELVDGETLSAWTKRDNPPSWQQRLARLREAAEGLAAAHNCGIVHRDFKPDNVMVDARRGAKVVDFGLARALHDETPSHDADESLLDLSLRENASASPAPDGSLTLKTETGALVGTPAYMAPEQFEGRPATAASDQFAFCVSAFEVLFGVRPFPAPSIAALCDAKLRGAFEPPPKDSPVPRRVRQAILRGLAVDPAARHPSMRALIGSLKGPAGRHPARAAIVTGVLVGGSVFGGMLVLDDDDAPCDAGAQDVAEVWNPPARDALRAQLHATAGAPPAEAVVTHLDAYAQRWADQRDAACAATHVEQTQSSQLLDRRVACLDELRTDLGHALSVLADGGDPARVRAVDVTRGLAPPEDCGDIARLLASVPPPSSEQAASAQRARDALSLAQTLIRAAQYDEALEHARRGHREASSVDYRPLIAEAMMWEGFTQDRLGQWDDAEASLSQAAWLAQRVGHDPVVTRAMTELTFVVGRHLGRHEDGLLWAKHADAMAERLGDPLEQARLQNNRATVLSDAGQYAPARGDYDQAIATRTERLGAEHPDTLTAKMNLAALLDQTGAFAAANTTYENVLAGRRALLGDRHPSVAAVLVNYGELLARTGTPKRGASLIEEAVEIFDETDARPSLRATALQNLAVARYYDDQLPEALTTFEKVLEIRTRLLGPNHADVAYLHVNLGGVALDLDDRVRAREEFALGRVGLEAALGPDHPSVADVLMNSAVLELEDGHMDLAAEYAGRSVEIRTEALSAAHPETGQALSVLAEAELGRGNAADALARSEEALAGLTKAEGVPTWRLTKARFLAAAARRAQGADRPADLARLATLAAELPEDRAKLRQRIEALLSDTGSREHSSG